MKKLMSTFLIDVPVPSMGATVSELTIVAIVVAAGAEVTKGQKLADLESDKSAFDFESPAAGKILEIRGRAGEVKRSGETLFRMETTDQSLQHLAIATARHDAATVAGAGGPGPGGMATPSKSAAPASAPGSPTPATVEPTPSSVLRPLIWTPRALKLAQEAGLDPTQAAGIAATGPGGRVSGDDVTKYLAERK
ncbi:MAG: biotin/lipoyl-containing protein [Opitutales bacterium]